MEERRLVTREKSSLERDRRIAAATPIVDIYENDDEILLQADMPGIQKDDVVVNIDNGKLELIGRRHLHPSGSALWVEFGDVEYRRSFSIPQTIDIDKVNAELNNGVLHLHLPKSDAAKPRQIEIKST